jgi:PfaB family protein
VPDRSVAEGGRSGRYTAVLVAGDAASLARELDAAARSLPAVVAEGGQWATPGGSYCTARPAGPGKVAFVYPGAFTSYPGAGCELFRLFPGLLAEFERHADRPRERFKHGSLYHRGAAPIDRGTLTRREAELIEDIPVMLAIGINLAVLHTQLLRDVLGIAPHGGFGYSLGESSMLFAMDVWAGAARDDAVLAATPLFRDRLRGPKTLIRELWGLGAEVADSAVWATHVLLARPDAVRAAMAGLDRVFLTQVNTPGEVVVAGDPAQCRTLIERIGCQSARAAANHVMHVPLVRREISGLAELNSYPLGSPAPGLELLSAFDYDVLGSPDRAVIAERIAGTLCDTIDFARLASTAHDRGFRYFVEVGPGATCTRWIAETLTGRPHVAVSIDRRGVPAGVALAKALARLISNGLPVDLSVLFPAPPPAPHGLTISVPVGAEPIPRRVAHFGRACGAFEEGVRSESAQDPAAAPAVPAVPAVPAGVPEARNRAR